MGQRRACAYHEEAAPIDLGRGRSRVGSEFGLVRFGLGLGSGLVAPVDLGRVRARAWVRARLG